MYFKNFPKIYYDFDIKGDNNRQLFIVTDVTKNVRFRKQILSNITLYDYYDIKDGETPEIIAEKIYGNPEYHWIIMLANDRYDYIKDFPMDTHSLEEFIKEKYCQISSTDLVIGKSYKIYELGDTNWNAVAGTTNVNYLVGSEFICRHVGTGEGLATDLTYVQVYEPHHFIDENGFIVDQWHANAAPVSNYEYEDSVNESKRRIKIVSKNLINTILKNFETL